MEGESHAGRGQRTCWEAVKRGLDTLRGVLEDGQRLGQWQEIPFTPDLWDKCTHRSDSYL